jgi:hypothetical protein
LNLPYHNGIPFALDLNQIAQGQHEDSDLWKQRMQHPLQYPEKIIWRHSCFDFQTIANRTLASLHPNPAT